MKFRCVLQHANILMKTPDTKGPIFLNVVAKEASVLDKSLSPEGKCVAQEQREEN